jgi:hypothetical protein
MLEQLSSLIEEVEAEENDYAEPLRLEAVLKRYSSSNKIVRRIYISEQFNERDELDKYDRAVEKGQRYCIVTIRLLPKVNLALHMEE